MKTLNDFLNYAANALEEAEVYFGHGTDNAWDEAVWMAIAHFNFPPHVDASEGDRVLSNFDRQELMQLLEKRIQTRQPLAYLLGATWFAGEKFLVDKRVIIPRSPLAELILAKFSPYWPADQSPKQILDLCTGSGCIGIACAKNFPDAKVILSDMSEEALQVAEQNIQLNQCSDRVKTCQSDLFDQLKGQQFDIIVSNPPYVAIEEMEDLPEEYLHEPEMALTSGQDGLHHVRTILQKGLPFLKPNGILVVELGYTWPALEEAYPDIDWRWLTFESGGEGIFLLTREEWVQYTPKFMGNSGK